MAGKKHFVYSTLSTDMLYTAYTSGGGDMPVVAGEVWIKGGAGIPDRHLRSSGGVMTEVSDSDLEMLEANQVFQLHKKNGFIVVSDKKTDPEKVAADDMNSRDQSAPLQDGDFADDMRPKTNTPEPAGIRPSRKA